MNKKSVRYIGRFFLYEFLLLAV